MTRAAGLALLAGLLIMNSAGARPLRIAVASSLMNELRQQLHDDSVQLVPGATGKLSAQIEQGAPFDLFLAADSERPARLLKAGAATRCSEHSRGRLVAWTAADQLPDEWGKGRIAIAEPRLAPYGRAAQQALERLGSWEPRRIIRGQNVGQAMQFAASGHAPVALISLAQAVSAANGHYEALTDSLHEPIIHQLCLLNGALPAAAPLWEQLTHHP